MTRFLPAGFTLLALLLFVRTGVGETSRPLPTVERVDSAAYCAPCVTLRDELRKCGQPIMVVHRREAPSCATPTVLYSDGTTDNGARVYRGEWETTLTAVRWVEWGSK